MDQPFGQKLGVGDDYLAVVIVQQGRDGRIGKGRNERPEGLERGHADPPRLIAEQVDEEWREDVSPDVL